MYINNSSPYSYSYSQLLDGIIKTWLKLRAIRKEINETQARYDAAQCRCLDQKQAIINIQLNELRLQANKSDLESDLEQLVSLLLI